MEKAVFHIEYVQRLPIFRPQPHGRAESDNGAEYPLTEGEGPTIAGWNISNKLYPNTTNASLRSKLCLKGVSTLAPKMSTVIKQLNLDGWVMYCNGQSAITTFTDPPHGHLPPPSYGFPVPGIDHGQRNNRRLAPHLQTPPKGTLLPKGTAQTPPGATPQTFVKATEKSKPFDQSDEEADRQMRVELTGEDDVESEWVLKRTGAMKDRRPSPKWLAMRKRELDLY
jgi:hypothetical protein